MRICGEAVKRLSQLLFVVLGVRVSRGVRFLTRHAGDRVLLIGHVATHWGLQHYLHGQSPAELAATDFDWKLGWEHELTDHTPLTADCVTSDTGS